MRFDVITIFPESFTALTEWGITSRALKEKKASVHLWSLRDYADNAYRSIDDRPYGGGAGMIMKPEPIAKALAAINKAHGLLEYDKINASAANLAAVNNIGSQPLKNGHHPVIYLSPQGLPLTQNKVLQLRQYASITLLCGRYEGVDQRVLDLFVDEEISIGDFVVSGGELPAMMLMDALIRLIDGVIRDDSTRKESFSLAHEGGLEYPQYTRPEVFEGLRVPEVLLGGHHADIQTWQKKAAQQKTKAVRPDLVKSPEVMLKKTT